MNNSYYITIYKMANFICLPKEIQIKIFNYINYIPRQLNKLIRDYFNEEYLTISCLSHITLENISYLCDDKPYNTFCLFNYNYSNVSDIDKYHAYIILAMDKDNYLSTIKYFYKNNPHPKKKKKKKNYIKSKISKGSVYELNYLNRRENYYFFDLLTCYEFLKKRMQFCDMTNLEYLPKKIILDTFNNYVKKTNSKKLYVYLLGNSHILNIDFPNFYKGSFNSADSPFSEREDDINMVNKYLISLIRKYITYLDDFDINDGKKYGNLIMKKGIN